jgi:glycogen operon protein
MLATLLLSQGVPMVLAGDEIGRTQLGNNNAYCQDNEISWVHWEAADRELLAFARRLSALRHEHPVFRRRRFFEGRPVHGNGEHDIAWYTPKGAEMSQEDWEVGYARSLTVFLNGDAIATPGPRGEHVQDDHFLLLFNANLEATRFSVPREHRRACWRKVVDTSTTRAAETDIDVRRMITVPGFTLYVLQRQS